MTRGRGSVRAVNRSGEEVSEILAAAANWDSLSNLLLSPAHTGLSGTTTFRPDLPHTPPNQLQKSTQQVSPNTKLATCNVDPVLTYPDRQISARKLNFAELNLLFDKQPF